MIHEYKSKENLAIGLAIILFVVAAATAVNAGRSGSTALALAANLVEAGSFLLFIWGCCITPRGRATRLSCGRFSSIRTFIPVM